MGRFKKSYQNNATTAPATAGYLLWCPDYHNRNNAADSPHAPQLGPNQGCVFRWVSDTGTRIPTNSAANPYGSLTDNNSVLTTKVLDDPATTIVAGSLATDARVLSACVQMTYYGKMQDSSGEVGYISNLPVEALLGGTTGVCPSVNDLMAFANNKQRLGTDTLENVYRCNPESSGHFRSATDILMDVGGQTLVPTVMNQSAATMTTRCFGFVWRNVQGNAGITFDLTKNVEWRAAPESGLTQTVIHTTGTSLVPHVNAAIDTAERQVGTSLWERVKGAFSTVGASIAKIAHTGVSPVLKKGTDWLLKEGLAKGASAALPLLLT